MSAASDSGTVRPHATSLAVWDIPSPAVVNRHARLKIGAKCAAACSLAGETVHVHDQAGAMLATAVLGESPWPGTDALFWTEVEVPVPSSEGAHSWSISFTPRLDPPHERASAAIDVLAVRPPEHRISVEVVDGKSGAGIEGVALRVGPYPAVTDQRGLARVDLSGGTYPLTAWKAGYVHASQAVTVAGDLQLRITLAPEVAAEEPYWM